MRTSALILILALAASSPARSAAPMPRATPESVGMSSERLQSVTALLRQFVADRKIAGAVAGVARRGKVVYLESVGLQSRETRAPMSERTLFRVYSMTKAVTGVAVMMLADEGRLRLGDAAARYLPEFKDVKVGAGENARRPARDITIEDLLLHTSGLSHRTSELYRRLEVRSRAQVLPQFVTNITRAPLMEDPGTRFRYSEATTVLGRIVEVVSGQSFDAFVAARILAPLEMRDTSFWVDSVAAPRLATVYQRAEDGSVTPFEIEQIPFTQKPALMEGAVGLVSTAPDFLRFCQMLLNKGELDGVRLLKAATVEAMTRNGLSDEVLKERGSSVGWGLANVDVVVAPGSRGYLTNVGEYGWDGSAGTFFAVDPSRELVVTLMTQNLPANPDSLRQKFKQAVLQSVVDAPPSQADDFDPDSMGTFSIIARDEASGELGMAVQSKAFAAGNRAMTIKGGVAVIAHQASANPMYGSVGLELMATGMAPQQALDFMLRADEGRDNRQVAILDMQGRTAAWTGKSTNDWKGHKCGTNYCAQGNILVGAPVVDAMAASFEKSSGPLAERLMDALDAAQAAGGDARGMQSGAIVIVRPLAGSGGFSDRLIDVRVDDHRTPLAELRRLLKMVRSGQLIQDANRKVTENNLAEATTMAQRAVEMSPENDNAWVAIANIHLRAGRRTQALEAIRRAVELNPGNKRQLPRNANFQSLASDAAFLAIVK
jgi:CubicO group peptidase (beta-lactamase class C family)/uncharacterized Ntn-hydrolase superfamily protein